MNGIIRATWKGCLSLAGAAFLATGCNTLPVMAPSDVSYLPSAEKKAYEVEVLADSGAVKASPAPMMVAMQDASTPASSTDAKAETVTSTVVSADCSACSECTTCSKPKLFKHKGCSTCSSCSTGCETCAGTCDGGCGNCNSCRGGLNFCDKLHAKLDNVDWEQLHPDHCWLDQYARESRRRVNIPFKQQMINGNRLEQTIWTHYFEKTPGREHLLNVAGKTRLQYLARRRPFVVPSFFLQDSFDKELNEKRAQSVKEAATLYAQGDMGWVVNVINTAPVGLFGGEGRAEISNMLDNRYFRVIKVDLTGTSGGASGGGQSAGTTGF